MRSAPRPAAATLRREHRVALAAGAAATAVAIGVRLWNALAGPLGWGYDAWGHAAYVLYLDFYHALPHADQGWSYFHPPLHYLLSWPFAWTRSGEVLLRGMVLVASAASLGTAWLAARVQRDLTPARSDLVWLAFGAVAFLPAQWSASAMPGNEPTAAFCVSLAIAHFALRADASPARDLATGALLGLALLAKYSAFVAVAAVFASLASEALLASAPRAAAWRRALRRAAVMGLALLVVAGPFYARNAFEQGRLMPTSRDDPFVRAAESGQPPGERHALDYLRFPPRLFADANPLAPHLLGSVWGSLYANTWFDTHHETDRDRVLLLERSTPGVARALIALGLLPTGLAAAGAVLALRDAWRGRRGHVYLPLLWLAVGMLGAQALFAWRVPTWAAVKSSYLLPASLAFAVFVARGFESLGARAPRAAAASLAALVATAVLAALVAVEGLAIPRRIDAPTAGAAHFTFGEYDAARDVYGALLARSFWPVPWLDGLAATQLAQGDAKQARVLYERAVVIEDSLERESVKGDALSWRRAQLAVATALAGDEEKAAAALEHLLARGELPELRANLGVLRARGGRIDEAVSDLRAALAADAEMWPVAEDLAWVLRRAGRDAEAGEALAAARDAACRAPRGVPRAIGTGENVEWGVGRRWLLHLTPDGALRVTLPTDQRGACARIAAERS
jgi:tetratricopeptide (TPR) repeat protein